MNIEPRIVIPSALIATAPRFNSLSGPVYKLGAGFEVLQHDAPAHVAIYLPFRGLIFTAEPINAEPRSQYDLDKACAECAVLDVHGWQLPEVEELSLFIDRTRYSPATNTDLLRLPRSGLIWSKTPAAWSLDAAGVASAAWFVYALGGSVSGYGRDGRGFGLAVRRVGQ